MTMKIKTKEQLAQQSTNVILSIYNGLTGKSTKKFASREKGIDQTWKEIKVSLEEEGSEETKKRAMRFEFPVGEIKNHRAGTKRAQVIEMLTFGATFEEIRTSVGWDRKTAYEGIRLIHYYVGYGLTQGEDGKIYLVTD